MKRLATDSKPEKKPPVSDFRYRSCVRCWWEGRLLHGVLDGQFASTEAPHPVTIHRRSRSRPVLIRSTVVRFYGWREYLRSSGQSEVSKTSMGSSYQLGLFTNTDKTEHDAVTIQRRLDDLSKFWLWLVRWPRIPNIDLNWLRGSMVMQGMSPVEYCMDRRQATSSKL